MSGLDPARREELAEAVNEWSRPKSSAEFGGDLAQDFLAPLIARWLADARAEAWDEGAEATAEWMSNNPGPSGVPIDPPRNPYEEKSDG